MGVSNRLSAAYPIALAVVLAVLAGPAAALGLGQIIVKSRPGQPLLAEIPVISSDPAELDQLQARLASPETFRRVGLEPPTGAASDLQFAVGLDARGHSVIRVTSATPIQQPLLTFLVEVDWGEGRLVREYSALVDAPRTVAAPMQAPIQAAVVAPSNIIVRPVQAPIAAAPTPRPESPGPRAPAPTPAPKPIPAPRAAPAPTATPAPVARTSAVPSPSPPPAVAVVPHASQPAEYGPVRRGQTLSQIAGRLDAASAYTLDQTMLALLRANPEAFIGDDINRLKQGAVLRMPAASELSRYSATQAAAVVREQMANWRQAQRPTLQPAATTTATPAASARAASARGNTAAPRVADARLEIVPPSSSNGRRAGTRSGIDAGGEGDMLRQQLQQSNETLAARTAEVQELKTRVAELEKLQQQQQQLLTMKDSALAAAQQNLAKANRPAAAAAVPAATAQVQQPRSATPDHADRDASIWIGTGAALIAAALLAWWLASRRRMTPTSVRRFDTAALAASIPTADAIGLEAADQADAQLVAAHTNAGAMTESGAIAATTSQDPVAATPTWHAGAAPAPAPEPEPEPVAADVANASQQLELARAYLDLGDDNAARELLREVMDGRDPAARSQAARLLRDL